MSSLVVQDLTQLLAASSASDEFKKAVGDLKGGKMSDSIRFKRGLPPVKVLRVISKLLEEEPGLGISQVEVDAFSGCSDFAGKLVVNGGEAEFTFDWDCAWRAQEQGLKDYWGNPDQARAAQVFGYQCFKLFKRAK